METRYTPGPAVNVTLSELPTGWPSTSSSWLVVLLNAWRSKSFSGFAQFAVTMILWTAGSVPVTLGDGGVRGQLAHGPGERAEERREDERDQDEDRDRDSDHSET